MTSHADVFVNNLVAKQTVCKEGHGDKGVTGRNEKKYVHISLMRGHCFALQAKKNQVSKLGVYLGWGILLSKIATLSALQRVPKSRLTTKFHGKLVRIYKKLAGIFSDQSGFRDFKGRHGGRSLNPDYAVIVSAKKLFLDESVVW